MDNEIWEVLSSFKSAIDMIINRVDEMDKMYEENRSQVDERLHDLESTLYDEIIRPTQEYIDETSRNERFDEFNGKYGEKLGAYNDALRALEGNDFDLTRSAFDKYDGYEGEDKPDEEAFVDALISEVGSQLDQIKRGLGLPEDAEVSVTQTEDGETVVEADGQAVTGEDDELDEDEELEDEEVADEELDEDEELEGDDSPEAIAAFEEELLNQK